jgi:hypothetical protein
VTAGSLALCVVPQPFTSIPARGQNFRKDAARVSGSHNRNIINESHITKVTLVDAIKTGVGLRNPGSATNDPDVFGSIVSSSEQDRGMTIEFIARKPVAVGLVKDDKEFKTFIVNPGDRLKVNSNGEIVP